MGGLSWGNGGKGGGESAEKAGRGAKRGERDTVQERLH